MLHKLSLRHCLSIALVGVTLVACSKLPPEAYFPHGSPESLLDESSEIVNFDINGSESVDELVEWVNQDQPSRAELYCYDGDPLCLETHDILEQFGIPVLYVASEDNVVTLVYERILARDCENRFIDNSINPYNTAHLTYGCSVASNIVQMVTDKRQFTSPALLDYIDGNKADHIMRGYSTPNEYIPRTIDPNIDNTFDIDTGS